MMFSLYKTRFHAFYFLILFKQSRHDTNNGGCDLERDAGITRGSTERKTSCRGKHRGNTLQRRAGMCREFNLVSTTFQDYF